MKDIQIVLYALHSATHDSSLSNSDRLRARELFDDLTVAENNSAHERVTAEFRDDGSLVLLTR